MRILTPLLAAALLLAAPGVADHCETYSTTEPEVTVGPYYVDTTCDIEWCPVVWIYEETNGIDGLQRDDELLDDTCHGSIRGDTIIF